MKEQRQHIQSLLSDLDLKVRWVNRRKRLGPYYPVYMARPYEGRVWLPPINTEIDYWTALHEIGHCESDYDSTVEGRELLAWIWACENSIVPPSKGVKRYIEFCLGTYGVELCIS